MGDKLQKNRYYKFIFLVLISSLTSSAQHNWTRTNPGGGGAIATVGATVNGTILVASDLSGIYRSTDNGESFDVVGANQGLTETHISAFGFDPNDNDTFFVGSYLGAYKTTDGGESFEFVFPGAANAFDYSYIEDIVIAKSDSSIAYITHHPDPAASGEIYKTIDAGETWHSIPGNDLPSDLHYVKLMVHPSSADIVYALTGKTRWGCSEANLYRSENGGENWIEIGSLEGDVLDFDLHPTDSNIVFISTFESTYTDNDSCKAMTFEDYISSDETAGAFYKSINGGLSFTEISDKTGIISVGIENPDIIRLLDVLFPWDWNADAGTWETTNGGNSWEHTGFVTDWNPGYIEEQYFAFTGSYNGLNKSVTKDLFNSDRFYGSFGQWAWGSFDAGVTLNNISTKEISENHWLSTGVENINGHCLDINESNSNVIYIGGYDIGFWRTQDHGASWTRSQPDYNIYPEYSWNIGAPGTITDNLARRGAGANVMTLLNDPEREEVVWASFSNGQFTDPIENTVAYTGLFKSIDYGEHWVLVNTGLPAYEDSVRMYGLSIDINSPTDNRTLYLTVAGDIYKSSNDGIDWNLVLENGFLKFTEVDKFNSNIVYAGGSAGLWRSTNAGESWEEVGTSEMRNFNVNIRPDIVPTWTIWGDETIYPWEGVFDIQTDPNIPNRLYVSIHSEEGGVYRSDNTGETWSDRLIADTHLRGVAIAPENSNIIYATSSQSYHSGGHGNSLGILYSTDAGLTWEDANDDMAYNYAGMLEVEVGENPFVWVWSPGTGVQMAEVPYFSLGNECLSVNNDLIYPNPTTGKIIIPNRFINASYSVELADSKVVLASTTKRNFIDLSPLSNGIYFLTITNENSDETIRTKIIKN